MTPATRVILAIAVLAAIVGVAWGYASYRSTVRRRLDQDVMDRLSHALNDSVRENRDRMAAMSQQAGELHRTTQALHQTCKELVELRPLREQVTQLKGHVTVLMAEVEHHRERALTRRKGPSGEDDFADTQIDPEAEDLS